MAESFDERTVHRLEAFSDIVIGFGLAQLGSSLAFTKDLSLDGTGIIAFFGTFAIVCSLWYFHHRVFQWFFVPKGWPIVLNFVWLAVVVLLVFSAVQFSRAGFGHRTLDELYFGLYAIAYGILALQTLIGIRVRSEVTPEQRVRARRNITFMTYWTAVFVVNFALVYTMPIAPALGMAIDLTFLVGATGSALLGVYFRRRMAATRPSA